MLELPRVTLLAIDTANHALALRALARSRENIRFARTLFLTDAVPRDVPVPAGIDVEQVGRLDSREAYSRFVLKGLPRFVATSHLLLVQWDGYAVNPEAWEPAFLDCDYIGAQWFWQPAGFRVGNGGFSLRSRRLLDALQDPRIELRAVEDLTICHAFRPLLEHDHAIRFATEALADRFAFEAAHPIGKPFGFHGLFNFARMVPADELAAMAGAFSDAIARSPQMAQLVRNCIARGLWSAAVALAQRRRVALPDDFEARALLEQSEAGAKAAPAAGRNDPCPCGSGKRYKHCHGALGAATGPPAADTLVQVALAAHQRGALDDAERDYRAALVQTPDHPLALHYLGVVAYQRGRAAEALPLLERTAALRPQEPEFHNNLGLALAELDRPDDAVAAFRRTLAQNAQHASAWSNLGLALTACNALPAAIDALRRAVALAPDYGEAHWNLALALLANGEFAEGWREYEWRLRLPAFAGRAPPPGPRWTGATLAGQTLLVTAEQGLGDTLHFARFARMLAARGMRVVIQAPRPLVNLLATVPGVERAVAADDPVPPFDAQIPLLSLPGALGIAAGAMAGEVPYVTVDARRRAAVVHEVERIAGASLRVGLSWAGACNNTNDRRRSCPPVVLAPLFDVPGVAWFSLQKGDSDNETIAVPAAARLARLDARNDFDGTAALVSVLDVVITVDTSIAHLAGALGRPTWIMLPFASDWRWQQSRSDTPWYPAARLFRQPHRGDWSSVVAAVRAALAENVRER